MLLARYISHPSTGDQRLYDLHQAALERGEPIEASIHTIANLLKIFFRSLSKEDRILGQLDVQSLTEGCGACRNIFTRTVHALLKIS